MAKPTFQSPSGTRDLYPADLLRRRYIEKLWRDTSIRHGFEEIDGPTFEHADLYAVKSGEGILSEVFQVFSGKDEAEVSRIRGGANAPYALRPEFTPTLARMYAAKAGSLAKPTKWFWQQNCFRAEKQQRGRLREFGQWNCDILGGENDPESRARVDADCIACVVEALWSAGLDQRAVSVAINDRQMLKGWLLTSGAKQEQVPTIIELVDRLSKIGPVAFLEEGQSHGISNELLTVLLARRPTKEHLTKRIQENFESVPLGQADTTGTVKHFIDAMDSSGLLGEDPSTSWCMFDTSIVRGLAYYTGTVFEVLADGERAIAGGGRYDNLIELFGGPPTPAVGFGMGDVVLSLVLQDRGLMPEGDALMDALSRPSASYRPDVFVIPAGQTPADQEAASAKVRPLVAQLRRGVESKAYQDNSAHKPWDANRYDAATGGVPPMHARSSSKASKNIGKLLQDAAAQKAKLAVIVENAEEVTIKDLRTNTQDSSRTRLPDLGQALATRLMLV
jgi:histidyl-tRNA synthetase